MRPRLIAILCAPLALFSIYCDQTVGGGLSVNGSLQRDGNTCVNNAGCNSFNCVGGFCAAPASGLIEVDGDCTGGGSCVPNTSCQGGICVQTSAWCVPDGTACSSAADCCKMDCMSVGDGTSMVCGTSTGTGASTTSSSSSGSPSCIAQQGTCTLSSQCCMGNCDPGSLTCCFSTGTPCTSFSDCCSQDCDTNLSTCN